MKNYTLRIEAAGWSGTGINYEQVIEETETTDPDWDREGFIDWINEGKDFEDMQRIVDRKEEHDVRFTVTIYDEEGNTTYTERVWESEAAETALKM